MWNLTWSKEINNKEYFLSEIAAVEKKTSAVIVQQAPSDREEMMFPWLVILNLCSQAGEVPRDYIWFISQELEGESHTCIELFSPQNQPSSLCSNGNLHCKAECLFQLSFLIYFLLFTQHNLSIHINTVNKTEILNVGSVAKLSPKANTPDLYTINPSLLYIFAKGCKLDH